MWIKCGKNVAMQVRLTPDNEKMLEKALPIAKRKGYFNGHRGSAAALANFILWTTLSKMLKSK